MRFLFGPKLIFDPFSETDFNGGKKHFMHHEW